MLDLVTSTIEPQTWDSAGGPGSIDFFPYTLDFVVAQTREVHQQLEAFFDRLRRLPWVFHDQPGIRPARVPSVGSLPERRRHGTPWAGPAASRPMCRTWPWC
jgi:hypothetical protein